jgi:hypothetical protein
MSGNVDLFGNEIPPEPEYETSDEAKIGVSRLRSADRETKQISTWCRNTLRVATLQDLWIWNFLLNHRLIVQPPVRFWWP